MPVFYSIVQNLKYSARCYSTVLYIPDYFILLLSPYGLFFKISILNETGAQYRLETTVVETSERIAIKTLLKYFKYLENLRVKAEEKPF